MPRKILIAIVLLVVGPLSLLAWSASRLLREDEQLARLSVRNAVESRLRELDDDLAAVMRSYARRLETASEVGKGGSSPIEMALDAKRSIPFVRRVVVIDPKSTRVHPPPPRSEDPNEIAFDATLDGLISARPRFDGLPASKKSGVIGSRGRWQVWFFDEGAQWIYWFERRDGHQVGYWIERSRLLADLIEALPSRSLDPLDGPGNPRNPWKDPSGNRLIGTWTQWVQPGGDVYYGWGDRAAADLPIIASVPLRKPLATWSLQTRGRIPIPSSRWAMLAAFASIAVLLVSVGVYLTTSIQRQIRQAQTRVDFASHVSHELRTPLTNIQLYAELAMQDLESCAKNDREFSESAVSNSISDRLTVIHRESQRLGRLVSGVLEWVRQPQGRQRQGRQQQGGRTLSHRDIVPDELIEEFLDRFIGDIKDAELNLVKRLSANSAMRIDPDVLGQCFSNLISNAIKYSHRGGPICVTSEQTASELRVLIADSAGRLTPRQAKAIFRPFRRLDDSVTAPAGTGIGLTIARRLARIHGGDLKWLRDPDRRDHRASDRAGDTDASGNVFELTLSVEPIDE